VLFSRTNLLLSQGKSLEFQGRDVISIEDFTREEVDYILEKSKSMEPTAIKPSDILKGKILATLFFEPSTRTRLSFEAAMQKLGGTTIGIAEVENTSIKKGENLADTIRRCNRAATSARWSSKTGSRIQQGPRNQRWKRFRRASNTSASGLIHNAERERQD
jgi:ornithine carbamoyltransferase